MKTAGLTMICMAAVFVWFPPDDMNIVNAIIASAGLICIAIGSFRRERR
jgi:hypothetical protein